MTHNKGITEQRSTSGKRVGGKTATGVRIPFFPLKSDIYPRFSRFPLLRHSATQCAIMGSLVTKTLQIPCKSW